MSTQAGSIETTRQGRRASGRLSRMARGLYAGLVSRSRVAAGETDTRPLREWSPRGRANGLGRAMDAGITGGISLLGGQAVSERRRG